MERTSLPGLAAPDAQRHTAAGLRGLRLRLEPLALRRLLVQNAGLLLTAAAGMLAAAVYISETLARHRAFQSNAYDLGFFDQIVWNASQGRFFETSFVGYNFLGQHFDPVLLLFAAAYRAGAGVEFLLVTQAVAVAVAAVPLFLAARRFAGSQAVAAACALAYLLSAPVHKAVMFDFHPELFAFLFLFLGAYFLAAARPVAAGISVLPLLSLKEDMALVVFAFDALIWLRGHHAQAKWLGGAAAVWMVATVFVAMPLIRGGSGDLTRRYSYLVEGSSIVELVPVATARAVEHLAGATRAGLADLLVSNGLLPLLSPAAVFAAPLVLVNGLSNHPEQARLDLHYAAPSLALLWLATLMSMERLAQLGRSRGGLVPAAGAAVLLAGALSGFVTSSPFAPGASTPALSGTHREALNEGLRRIPRDASVNAQSAVLPHLSQRRHVFEFPDIRRAGYVIVDSGLPISSQSLARGYATGLASLPERGYERIYEREGVEVWRLTR